ncbi:GntR family transcriptional regulator [Occultella kanbiaonis]|uniref:GntR family transcriptional regulator n=1 Tax=Occultella kanbiaonis TaxID=2675754 RepID=UPI0013D5E73B|nr:GntR family transcriptional regulator [Occultella kanbiaonis]
MTLQVRVDLTLGVPPYEQIRSQIAGHVGAGNLHPSDRLPTVRDLAADLGVAVGTVARAYRELEQSGLVQTRRRLGTVVADGVGREAAGESLQRSAAALVRAARAEGLSDDAVLDLVRGTLMAPGSASRPSP